MYWLSISVGQHSFSCKPGIDHCGPLSPGVEDQGVPKDLLFWSTHFIQVEMSFLTTDKVATLERVQTLTGADGRRSRIKRCFAQCAL